MAQAMQQCEIFSGLHLEKNEMWDFHMKRLPNQLSRANDMNYTLNPFCPKYLISY